MIGSPIRATLAALFAVLALGALTSAEAAALPRFAPGLKGLTFTGSAKKALFYKKGSGSFFYEPANITGEVAGETTLGNIAITFLKGSIYGCPAKGKETEMLWKGVKGTLGYINALSREVGLLLEPAKQPFAECAFGGSIRGSVIGQITPINTLTKKFTLTFRQKEGEQNIRKFEGGAERLLYWEIGGIERPLGFEMVAELATSTAMEIQG